MVGKALITGVTGQDGHYLTDLLKGKGYEVYGLVRRTSQSRSVPDCHIVHGDLTDPLGLLCAYAEICPDEVYNLGAMAHVGESFKVPHTTIQVNTLGTLNILECARRYGGKVYQASTSEMFGSSPPPQDETTIFHPRSPYGVSKLAAYWLAINYREAYGVHASNGILFNHESPKRGEDYVTRKICKAVARIKEGKQKTLTLGNLDAVRDWGHAEDFAEGMWRILQQPAGDYVLATGKTHTVRQLLDVAFKAVGIDDWTPYVKTDKEFYRPAEVENLCGNANKAKAIGWKPKWEFEAMIRQMVECELS